MIKLLWAKKYITALLYNAGDSGLAFTASLIKASDLPVKLLSY